MQQLLLFPCNGNALEAIACAQGSFEILGFIDDSKKSHSITGLKLPVFGREALKKFPKAQVLAVPGSPASYLMREEIIASLDLPKKRFARVIHPSAQISALAEIGYNTLIMAGAVVTANAKIGNHVCILPNTVVHHDVEIADYTLVGSGVQLAGGVYLGKNCYIGSGAAIRGEVEIGAGSIVGMGSVVLKSVKAKSKTAGNPARSLK